MANYERPLIYGGVFLVAGVLLWLGRPSDETARPPVHRSAASQASLVHSDYDADDFGAHFEHPKERLKNVFMPLLRAGSGQDATAASPEDAEKIRATVAGGDPNWIFTGMAIVNGKRLALLENSTSQQSGFVEEGDHWKTAKIASITSQSVTFVDADGNSDAVMRFNPDIAPVSKPIPDAGFRPLSLGTGLTGPIGQVNVSPLPFPNPQPGSPR
jgi:hypothetical protein